MSQLDQLLKFITETLQEGKDFTVAQAPKFVQEILWWKYYEALFWCGVGIGVIVFGALLGQFLTGFYETKEDWEERRTARWLPLLGGLVLGFCIITSNIYTIIQVRVAPRVVLVEMVRDMLRK